MNRTGSCRLGVALHSHTHPANCHRDQMFGSEYLGYVLDPILRRIFSSTVSVEVDPTRLEDGESVEANQVRAST